MKAKTARRFLRKNEEKIARMNIEKRANVKPEVQPAFLRRLEQATIALLKEPDISEK